MTRRTEMNPIQLVLYAALATGACLPGAHAQAPSKAKTFEQAVVEAQDLKSCKKKQRFQIHRCACHGLRQGVDGGGSSRGGIRREVDRRHAVRTCVFKCRGIG